MTASRDDPRGQEFRRQTAQLLVHFDRNGFGYTLDRETGELLVAEKFDPAVNWATKVDHQDRLPERVKHTRPRRPQTNSKGVCPAASAQRPAAGVLLSKTGLFYVPTTTSAG